MLLYLKVACSLSQPTLQTKTNKYCGTQKQASCYKKSFWGGFSLHANGVCARTCTNAHTCLYMYECVYVLVWIFMYVCGICVHGGLYPCLHVEAREGRLVSCSILLPLIPLGMCLSLNPDLSWQIRPRNPSFSVPTKLR